MSRYEKKLKDKLNDEIKLAGLEALVPEELEKHLTHNSKRLRAFEDARQEVVTYVEAKCGSRIRDSKPSDTGLRERSDPMDVDAVSSLSLSLSSVKEKDNRVRVLGVLSASKCGGAHFQRDCNASKNAAKQSSSKGNQSKSWSKSEPSIGSPKEPKVRSKVPKASNGKTLKTGTSGLENLKSETSSENQESV